MEHFLVKPDYDTIAKYYSMSESKEQFADQYAEDGYPIVIDAYYNSKDELFFSGDHIKQVEKAFKVILLKYDLLDHYDNLLFLILKKKYQTDQIFFAMEDEYLPQKRAQELAKLILAFKTVSEDHLVSISLKTTDSSDTAILKDKKLISWLGKLLLKAIDENKEPISLFSLTGDKFLRGSIEELKSIAKKTIKSPYVGRKKYLADFCFYLHPYLISETAIRPDVETNFSDSELNFYYEVLVLLEMLPNHDRIGSNPEDYIRTLLKNEFKK